MPCARGTVAPVVRLPQHAMTGARGVADADKGSLPRRRVSDRSPRMVLAGPSRCSGHGPLHRATEFRAPFPVGAAFRRSARLSPASSGGPCRPRSPLRSSLRMSRWLWNLNGDGRPPLVACPWKRRSPDSRRPPRSSCRETKRPRGWHAAVPSRPMRAHSSASASRMATERLRQGAPCDLGWTIRGSHGTLPAPRPTRTSRGPCDASGDGPASSCDPTDGRIALRTTSERRLSPTSRLSRSGRGIDSTSRLAMSSRSKLSEVAVRAITLSIVATSLPPKPRVPRPRTA
jgi:hypothetical protein